MTDRPRRSTRRRSAYAADAFSLQPEEPTSILRWCVDGGLLAAVFVLPFVMGGRQAIGEFTLVVIACWTTAAWLLHHAVRPASRWRFSGMEPLLLAGIAVCALQVITLTPDVLKAVSPHLARVLPLWESAGDPTSPVALVPGRWTTLSLVPAATLRSLCCVIAVSMLFVVAVQRIDSIADAGRLMRCIAVAGTLMAVFGCGQFLFGNGRFFGFYVHPFTHTRDYAKGAFTNPNHFANYLAMAVPLLLAWYAAQTSAAPKQQTSYYESPRERLTRLSAPIALLCLAAVSVGILLSQSRGGLVTACVGAIVTLGLLLRQRVLTMKAATTIGGIAVAALVSLTFFGAHIQSLIEHNFHELVSGDVEQLDHGDARQKIWAAAAKGIAHYPILGTGLSSHREVYWTYFDHPEVDGEFSHAESGYLQLTLETGFVGAGIAMCAPLLVLFWCGRGLRRTASPEAGALLAAIVGVLAVNLVHSITDFVWYVPSCMTVIALLAACASRLNRLSAADYASLSPAPGSLFSRGLALVGAAGVLALGVWMTHVQRPALSAEPHWFHYIRITRGEHQLADEFDRDEYRRHKLATIFAAADADPHNCRIQTRAAAAALTLYREERQKDPASMSLTNIREAGRTLSPEQLQEWLSRPAVLGDRGQLDDAWQRTQHALSLCPLLSEGYIRLGELAWIYGATRQQEDALLVQALLVRPYDPLVHYTAGQEAWLRGKQQPALEHWKRAFQWDSNYQQLIIDLLARAVPAQFFLDNFEADTAALTRLQEAYRSSPDRSGFETVTRLLAEQLSQDAAAARHRDAVRLWRKAHDAYAELGDTAGARRTAYAAVEADPNALAGRLLLGGWLYRNQEFAAAREHLEFCVLRRPQDRNLNKMLEIAGRRVHDPAPRTAMPPTSTFLRR